MGNGSGMRGRELGIGIGIVGAVVLLVVGLSGMSRGLGYLSSASDTYLSDEEWEGQSYQHDFVGQASSGELAVEASGVSFLSVVTEGADFDVRFDSVEQAVLNVDGAADPWTLERSGDTISVTAPLSSNDSDGPATDGSATDGPATDGSEQVAEEGREAAASECPAGENETPSAADSASETRDAGDVTSETSGAEGTAEGEDASESEDAAVTLTLPMWLRDSYLVGSVEVYGGTFTAHGQFADLNLMMTKGEADVSGAAQALRARVSGGTMNLDLSDVDQIVIEALGEGEVIGNFTDRQPTMVELIEISGTVDLTLPNGEQPYEVAVDNRRGDFTNDLMTEPLSESYTSHISVTIAGGTVALR
ncbi:hypothetical protein VR010_02420 [Actinomycetaceae bacterium L2_0104]